MTRYFIRSVSRVNLTGLTGQPRRGAATMILVLVALLLLVGVFARFRMQMQTWLIAAIAVFTLGLFVGGLGTFCRCFAADAGAVVGVAFLRPGVAQKIPHRAAV